MATWFWDTYRPNNRGAASAVTVEIRGSCTLGHFKTPGRIAHKIEIARA